MKPTCFILILLSVFVANAFAGNKNDSLSGVWKLNVEKTPPANNRIFLSKISFKLKNDSLFTIRTYENNNGETYPFDENLTLDGKEYKIVVYDLPRKARAYRSKDDGALIIESTTTFNGNSGEEDFNLIEAWKAAENGTVLTVNFAAKSSAGDTKGSYLFVKSE